MDYLQRSPKPYYLILVASDHDGGGRIQGDLRGHGLDLRPHQGQDLGGVPDLGRGLEKEDRGDHEWDPLVAAHKLG